MQLGQHVVVPVVRHFEEETVAQVERELLPGKDRVVCVCVRGKGEEDVRDATTCATARGVPGDQGGGAGEDSDALLDSRQGLR